MGEGTRRVAVYDTYPSRPRRVPDTEPSRPRRVHDTKRCRPVDVQWSRDPANKLLSLAPLSSRTCSPVSPCTTPQVETSFRQQLVRLDDRTSKSKATRLYGNEIAIAILSDDLYEKWLDVLRAVQSGQAVGLQRPKQGKVELKRFHYRNLATLPDAILHQMFDQILGSQRQQDDFYQSVLRVCCGGRGDSRQAQVWDDPPVDWFRTLRRYADSDAGVASYNYFLNALDLEVQEVCREKANLDLWHRKLTTVLGFDRVAPPLDTFYSSTSRTNFVRGLHAPLTCEAQNIAVRWSQIPAPFRVGTADDRYAKLCDGYKPGLKRKGDWWPPFVASDHAMNVYDASKAVAKKTGKRTQKVATPESDAAGNKFFVVVSAISAPATTWQNVLGARNNFIAECLEGDSTVTRQPGDDVLLNTAGRVVRREVRGSLLLTGAGSGFERMTPTEKKMLYPFYVAAREFAASRVDRLSGLDEIVEELRRMSTAVYLLARHFHRVGTAACTRLGRDGSVVVCTHLGGDRCVVVCTRLGRDGSVL